MTKQHARSYLNPYKTLLCRINVIIIVHMWPLRKQMRKPFCNDNAAAEGLKALRYSLKNEHVFEFEYGKEIFLPK